MNNNYLCPKCNGYLNVGENVIFATETKKGNIGLILLHPELGNYQVIHHPEYKFEEGEDLEFKCPLCHKKLTSKFHPQLANVVILDEQNKKFNVLFSKITGEESTYKIIGESMEAFGKDAANYENTLNLIQMN